MQIAGAARSGEDSPVATEPHRPIPGEEATGLVGPGEAPLVANSSAEVRSQHALCSVPSIGARPLSWAQYPRRPAIDFRKWRHEAQDVVERWQTQHLEVSA